MKQTKAALLARGLDSAAADALSAAGWTVQRLKLAQAPQLIALGLSPTDISLVQGGARPPIPTETLLRLLFENRYQCCVCRDISKAFIVHHIVEWSRSRNHDLSNLAVLCLEHHGKAHSISTLSQNLDADTLRGLKASWEREVKQHDGVVVRLSRKSLRRAANSASGCCCRPSVLRNWHPR